MTKERNIKMGLTNSNLVNSCMVREKKAVLKILKQLPETSFTIYKTSKKGYLLVFQTVSSCKNESIYNTIKKQKLATCFLYSALEYKTNKYLYGYTETAREQGNLAGISTEYGYVSYVERHINKIIVEKVIILPFWNHENLGVRKKGYYDIYPNKIGDVDYAEIDINDSINIKDEYILKEIL